MCVWAPAQPVRVRHVPRDQAITAFRTVAWDPKNKQFVSPQAGRSWHNRQMSTSFPMHYDEDVNRSRYTRAGRVAGPRITSEAHHAAGVYAWKTLGSAAKMIKKARNSGRHTRHLTKVLVEVKLWGTIFEYEGYSKGNGRIPAGYRAEHAEITAVLGVEPAREQWGNSPRKITTLFNERRIRAWDGIRKRMPTLVKPINDNTLVPS